MMKNLLPFIVMIIALVVMAVIVIHLMNYRLKRRILDAGPLDEHAVRLIESFTSMGAESLKWGLLLLFAGMGLVTLSFIPLSAADSSLPYGIETIFLALGFLTNHFLNSKPK